MHKVDFIDVELLAKVLETVGRVDFEFEVVEAVSRCGRRSSSKEEEKYEVRWVARQVVVTEWSVKCNQVLPGKDDRLHRLKVLHEKIAVDVVLAIGAVLFVDEMNHTELDGLLELIGGDFFVVNDTVFDLTMSDLLLVLARTARDTSAAQTAPVGIVLRSCSSIAGLAGSEA